MTVAKQQTETPPAEQKPKRKPDPELQAIARIDRILAELTDEQADRVTTWARSKYFPTNYTKSQQAGTPSLGGSTEPPK